MKHKLLAVLVLVLGAVFLALVFRFTDPVSIGFLGVVAVFLVIYLMTLAVVYTIAIAIAGRINKRKQPKVELNRRKVLYVSMSLAVAPVVVMSFFSLGAINIPEVILVVLLEVVAIFFINKRA